MDAGGIPTYVIRGGSEGRERLRALARLLVPTTDALFDRFGIAADARCLDVGCGGGDVTLALAARVPRGRVVGVDLDGAQLDLARGEAEVAGRDNVEYRVADVMEAPRDDDLGAYYLIYVRFGAAIPTSARGCPASCAGPGSSTSICTSSNLRAMQRS